MPFKDIFRHHRTSSRDMKANGRRNTGSEKGSPTSPQSPMPEFTFIRTDTTSQTVIHPPTGFSDHRQELRAPKQRLSPPSPQPRSRSSSVSRMFHPNRRERANTSANVPTNLPDARTADGTDPTEREAAWERRAAALVTGEPGTPGPRRHTVSRTPSAQSISAANEAIDEAIRLHQIGEVEKSTAMFGRLADPNGSNMALAQVFYGLALRHGWGIEKDEQKALQYLKAGAQNSAAIEEEALKAGMKRGGMAKGELVLAIYELGNSYKQGWGVEKDPVAAREYYETAANLGDSDAMNDVAWCYLEGFGCKKDKKKAAQFYRKAEAAGNKTLGNSWIYKDKYMGDD